MEVSNFILDVINNVLYNFAHVGAQGHECQSVHRNMHKIAASRHVLTAFYADNFDLDANDGTDRTILLGSKAWVPQPWDPVPFD